MTKEDVIKRIYLQSKACNLCDRFTGEESFDEFINLFLSPQGIEFCINNHMPDLATIRMFHQIPISLERYGIYIDAGEIELTNPRKAVLIGDTKAKVRCNTTERYEVVLMRGAQAFIQADNWSVVFITEEIGCSCVKQTLGNAVIL